MDTETRAIRMSELQLIVTMLHRRQSHASTIIIMVPANDREPDRALVSHIIAGFSDRRSRTCTPPSRPARFTLSLAVVYIWKQAATATCTTAALFGNAPRSILLWPSSATWTVRHTQEMPAGVKPAAALGGSPGSKESALIKIRGQHTKPCCAMLVRAR